MRDFSPWRRNPQKDGSASKDYVLSHLPHEDSVIATVQPGDLELGVVLV
jgi:hypothetical protein